MRILIIGSGLIGLTASWLLARRGHDVTVVDRQEGPGRETSFANGGLLTPSMSEPWNAPGSWRVLLGSLGRSDAPLQLRMRRLPHLVGWGTTFLRNSAPGCFERNARSNLRLALYSLQMMGTLRQAAGVEYGGAAPGALKIFRDPAMLDHAARAAERLRGEGLSFQRLTVPQTIELEPALAPLESELAGGIHFKSDEIGDAYRFGVGLAERAREAGVQFRFGTEVSSLEVSAGRVSAVRVGTERLTAERYIVAAGSYSVPLLRPVGIHLPVEPAKGYSVTFDLTSQTGALRVPIVDDDFHAAIVPFERAVRVAGTAEFAGFDLTLTDLRLRNLVTLLKRVLPRVPVDFARTRAWCGLRPMSADGVPIIGTTALANLLVSTAHGHLGWTMAAGSAHLLADLVEGNTPAIDPAAYALSRFH